MADATLCIPSNRPLSTCRGPLDSAIAYAKRCGMAVVIADNSGDDDKRSYYASVDAHVIYRCDAPGEGLANSVFALENATTEFVLMLGDDDFIALAEGGAPPDLAGLGADVIGLKPRIELWSATRGLMDVNDFTIDAADSAGRVIEYWRKMKGGNSTYYSFFRRKPFLDLYRLFVDFHPTRAGNGDFAQVFALVAEGRMLADPNTVFRYDNSHWEDQERAGRAMQGLFDKAGLPQAARHYMLLLHFLDSYVLVMRAGSTLSPIERYRAAYALAMVLLKRFLARAGQSPQDYLACADLLTPLTAAVASAEPDLDAIFGLAVDVADRLKPGLRLGYYQFLSRAMGLD